MKINTQFLLRITVLLALLMTSAVAFAQDSTTDTAESETFPFIGIRYTIADNGVLLTGIIPNTPAASADLFAGDTITAFNDTPIRIHTLGQALFSHNIGDAITLHGQRDGAAFSTDLTLMARPPDIFNNPDYPMPLDLGAVGLYVQQYDDQVYVVAVLAGTDAAQAGFHIYDQLIQVDDAAIDSIGAADAAMSYLEEGDELSLTVLRGDREMTMKMIVVDHRKRRPPSHQPPPRPRLETDNIYSADAIILAYSDSAIEIRELGQQHELYAAGLRAHDLITAANGKAIGESDQLFAGQHINLTIDRANSALHFKVPVSAAPLLMFGIDSPQPQDRGIWLGLHEKQVTLGVRFIQLEADSPYFEGSPVTHGAHVVEVIDGLPAADAGIQIDDIIIAVAGEPTTLEIDLRNRIYFHEPGETVTLDVLRDGEIIQVEVVLRVAS